MSISGHTSSLENGFTGTSPKIGLLAYAFYNGLFPYDGWWVQSAAALKFGQHVENREFSDHWLPEIRLSEAHLELD